MREKLGQHFLKNEEILRFITSRACKDKNETILEIGPGHGELTSFLIEKVVSDHAKKIISIEKDPELFQFVTKRFEKEIKEGIFQIIEGDARILLPQISETLTSPFSLVGNIPYYLTSFLFRIISELPNKPRTSTFLIQKEVAERACAKENDTNLLSASLGVWADTEILLYVPKNDFSPPPEVDSAVIQLVTHGRYTENERSSFFSLLPILFQQPRKTVLNNLKPFFETKKLKKEDILLFFSSYKLKENIRPQNLQVLHIIQLAKMLYNEK